MVVFLGASRSSPAPHARKNAAGEMTLLQLREGRSIPTSVPVNLAHQALKTRQVMDGHQGRGGKQDDDQDLDGYFQLDCPFTES
jgi:hypothetical protein